MTTPVTTTQPNRENISEDSMTAAGKAHSTIKVNQETGTTLRRKHHSEEFLASGALIKEMVGIISATFMLSLCRGDF